MNNFSEVEAALAAMSAVHIDPEGARQSVPVFQAFFRRHNIPLTASANSLIKTPSMIREVSSERSISDTLLNAMIPPLSSDRLLHYTPMGRFEKIAHSGKLQLSQLSAVLGSHEYTTFACAHGMDGIAQVDGSGRSVLAEIADTLFFASFAIPNEHEESELWDTFAGAGHGVRLCLNMTPKQAQLRSMAYHATENTLLQELNRDLMQAIGVPFVPTGISRLAAFALPSSYDYEGEVRLLLPVHQNFSGPELVNDDNRRFIAVDLNTSNRICDLDLSAIQLGPQASRERAERAIQGTVLQGVNIIS